MDFTTILSLLAGIALIVFGISFNGTGFDLNKLSHFYDLASIAITFGGTIMATIMSFPFSIIKTVPKQIVIAFRRKKHDPVKYIDLLVEFAQEARRKGILALEDRAMQQEDRFLRDSVMLIVDAIEPEKAKEILENELDCLEERHARARLVFDRAATFAPAFGMIGTLIGLINMLRGSDITVEGGAQQMVAGMAVALITTFYGSIFANLVLTPISNKLRTRHEEEMLCKEIIVEGVLAIGAGDNPRHIEERLYAFLKSSEREKLSNSKNQEAAPARGRR